ncbi:MAG: ORF6N domain-containing protein [Planctomycetes bacterium]|nr:ORF6N domain-containing protein [Planctomycetota bacterium]
MAPRRHLVITADLIERKIYFVRGQRVMLDSDLAELYGVLTKAINQAVRRNKERFPEDFAYQVAGQELAILKSQIVTSSFAHGGKRSFHGSLPSKG